MWMSLCQGDEMSADGVIFAVEIDAVERLLHRAFLERGAEVIGNLLRSVETDLFAERNEGVNDLGFVNAHGERSREPRFPFSTWCRVIAGAARLSARSGWAKVKALGEAPRPCPAQRDQSRGKRNGCAWWRPQALP